MESHKTVLVIEDHEIVIWALTAVIEKELKGYVIVSAVNIDEGLDKLRETHVNLVILDIDLPGGNSTSTIDRIRQTQPEVPILVHTGLQEQIHSVEYLLAGADGFVSKNAPLSELFMAISTVLAGKKYISPLTHDAIADRYLNKAETNEPPFRTVQLTDREKDVIQLILKGKWTKEIAVQLGLRLTTVSTHKSHIFDKFGVNNPVDLFKKVKQHMPDLLDEI